MAFVTAPPSRLDAGLKLAAKESVKLHLHIVGGVTELHKARFRESQYLNIPQLSSSGSRYRILGT